MRATLLYNIGGEIGYTEPRFIRWFQIHAELSDSYHTGWGGESYREELRAELRALPPNMTPHRAPELVG